MTHKKEKGTRSRPSQKDMNLKDKHNLYKIILNLRRNGIYKG